MRDNVARVRRLLEEAAQEKVKQQERSTEDHARTAFQLYEFNVGMAPLEQTPRARAEREIHRIAWTYGWQGEVARALDTQGAISLSALDDDQVERLAAKMRRLLDSAMCGCDSEDALPAR